MIFIDRVEDYLMLLPKTEDVIYSLFVSEYSAVNILRYFKKVDEVLLLGSSNDECMHLLGKKVEFFTVDISVMTVYLNKKFGLEISKMYQKSKGRVEKVMET